MITKSIVYVSVYVITRISLLGDTEEADSL